MHTIAEAWTSPNWSVELVYFHLTTTRWHSPVTRVLLGSHQLGYVYLTTTLFLNFVNILCTSVFYGPMCQKKEKRCGTPFWDACHRRSVNLTQLACRISLLPLDNHQVSLSSHWGAFGKARLKQTRKHNNSCTGLSMGGHLKCLFFDVWILMAGLIWGVLYTL